MNTVNFAVEASILRYLRRHRTGNLGALRPHAVLLEAEDLVRSISTTRGYSYHEITEKGLAHGDEP